MDVTEEGSLVTVTSGSNFANKAAYFSNNPLTLQLAAKFSFWSRSFGWLEAAPAGSRLNHSVR